MWTAILPAAGLGTRLRPSRYPKELLPVVYECSDDVEGVRPRAVSEFALRSFSSAGIEKCYIVISPAKSEILTYFGDGSALNMELAYLCQEEARGLPHALHLAYPWAGGGDVVFAMPDTILTPVDCVSRLRRLYLQTGADLALGVFPTDEPERLGPVVMQGNRVLRVYDKCPSPPARNTWGFAIWGARFWELLHRELQTKAQVAPEPVMGDFFNLAAEIGYDVRAEYFHGGSFTDIGTPRGIRRYLESVPLNRVLA